MSLPLVRLSWRRCLWQARTIRTCQLRPQAFTTQVTTPEKAIKTLRSHEKSIQITTGETVSKVESNFLPANDPCEDRKALVRCKSTDGLMFGVFDGHGGHSCAHAISQRLFTYMTVAMLPHQDLLKFSMEIDQKNLQHLYDFWDGIRQIEHDNNEFYSDKLMRFIHDQHSLNQGKSEVEQALIDAFLRLDQDLGEETLLSAKDGGILDSESLKAGLSGSCACVAYVKGRDLYIANAGDCRAVLGVQQDDGTVQAVPLSRDHNANNPDELERVRREHPQSEQTSVVSEGRLLRQLIPLRAFGDMRFKWDQETQRQLADQVELHFRLPPTPPTFHTPPYLTAQPECLHLQLQPSFRYLILATDGLWDFLDNRDAVEIVEGHRRVVETPAAFVPKPGRRSLGDISGDLMGRVSQSQRRHFEDNAATHLIKCALSQSKKIVDLKQLVKMLSLNPREARHHRDDITVVVVYFDTHSLQG